MRHDLCFCSLILNFGLVQLSQRNVIWRIINALNGKEKTKVFFMNQNHKFQSENDTAKGSEVKNS